MPSHNLPTSLPRSLSLPAAITLGLGAMLGTGVFVGLALASGPAGRYLPAAVAVAALLAWCNALSSAALASAHPVAGGTYEYAYRTLPTSIAPLLARSAGWLFLVAKSASCSAAALALSEAIIRLLKLNPSVGRTPIALAILCLIAAVALRGPRLSASITLVLVATTFAGLTAFVATAHPLNAVSPNGSLLHHTAPTTLSFLFAIALVFVAFTGYGRLATLGEEVRSPATTIPRAIHITLTLVTLTYLAVATAISLHTGTAPLALLAGTSAQPLAEAAALTGHPRAATLILFGSCAAIAGVMLNLLLGLSRVTLAMARRRDLPTPLATLSPTNSTTASLPHRATLAATAFCLLLTALGSIQLAWTLSAFTVLTYYAITNLCALYLPRDLQLPSSALSRLTRTAGLLGCLFLAITIILRHLLT